MKANPSHPWSHLAPGTQEELGKCMWSLVDMAPSFWAPGPFLLQDQVAASALQSYSLSTCSMHSPQQFGEAGQPAGEETGASSCQHRHVHTMLAPTWHTWYRPCRYRPS